MVWEEEVKESKLAREREYGIAKRCWKGWESLLWTVRRVTNEMLKQA